MDGRINTPKSSIPPNGMGLHPPSPKHQLTIICTKIAKKYIVHSNKAHTTDLLYHNIMSQLIYTLRTIIDNLIDKYNKRQ